MRSSSIFLGLALCAAGAFAGVNQWTQIGPPGFFGGVVADPVIPGILYANSGSSIFKSVDAGTTWNRTFNGRPLNLTADRLVISRKSPTVLYAVGGSGVLRSTDNGATFVVANGTGNNRLPSGLPVAIAVDPNDPQTAYVDIADHLYKTTDAGANWLSVASLPDTTHVLGVDPTVSSRLYASAGTTMYASPDGGRTWGSKTVLPLTLINAIGAMPSLVLAGGTGMCRSTNGGSGWGPADTGLGSTTVVFDIEFIGNTIFAATDRGLYRSTNGALTWSLVTAPFSGRAVASITIDAAGSLYASSQVLYRSTDGGATWSQSAGSLSNSRVDAVAFDWSTRTLYAAVAGQGVLKTGDNGLTWTSLNSGLSTNIQVLAVDPKSPSVMYAADPSIGIYKTTDGGSHWTLMNDGLTTKFVLALAIDPDIPSIVYAGVSGGGVFKSTDGGGTWVRSAGFPEPSVLTLTIDSLAIYAGTANGVFKSSDAGLTWSPGSGLASVSVLAIAVDPASRTVFAGTDGRGVFKSIDGGASWTAVNHGLPGDGVARVTALIADPRQTNVVYAVAESDVLGTPYTLGAGLFRSADAGATWFDIGAGSLLGVTALAIDHVSNTLFAATDDSGIFAMTTVSRRRSVKP